jgi:hypothetical protein
MSCDGYYASLEFSQPRDGRSPRHDRRPSPIASPSSNDECRRSKLWFVRYKQEEVMSETIPTVAFDEDNEILSPTEEAYGSFYEAFQVFNIALFEGELPDCLITMQRSRRS